MGLPAFITTNMTPTQTLAINEIHTVHALDGLRQLNENSVDCVVTSPPYWMIRDYGVAPVPWADGENAILGLEPDCSDYVEHLLQVFAGVQRVLKPSGTFWLNIGDSYGGQSTTVSHARHARGATSVLPTDISFMPAKGHVRGRWDKCLMGIPERLLLGLFEQGWILRNRIVWSKPNPMPSSVKDRFTPTWEIMYFLVKSPRYHFDLDAVRVPHVSLLKRPRLPDHVKPRSLRQSPHVRGVHLPPHLGEAHSLHPLGRNPGDFWSIPSETRSGGAILGIAGAVKVPGGSGWTGHVPGGQARIIREEDARWLSPAGKNPGDCWEIATNAAARLKSMPDRESMPKGHFAVYPERLCERPIMAGCPLGGLVLDPFCGTGTTCVVAKRLGRDFIGFELNPHYAEMARARLNLKPKQQDVAQPGEAQTHA